MQDVVVINLLFVVVEMDTLVAMLRSIINLLSCALRSDEGTWRILGAIKNDDVVVFYLSEEEKINMNQDGHSEN